MDEAFSWVLAKRQLGLAVDALSPRAFRTLLSSMSDASRAQVLALLAPDVAEAVARSLAATEDGAEEASGEIEAPPQVEMHDPPLRMRVPRRPPAARQRPSPEEGA